MSGFAEQEREERAVLGYMHARAQKPVRRSDCFVILPTTVICKPDRDYPTCIRRCIAATPRPLNHPQLTAIPFSAIHFWRMLLI